MVNMLRGISREVENTTKRIEELTARQKKMGAMQMRVQAFRDLPGQTKDVTKSIDDMSSAIYRSAQRWRTFGYLASITLTAPIVYAGKKAIETASDFEYSMNKIIGLVGLGRDKVAGFKKEIFNMSLATGQTATKLGEAMYYITSAGFKEGGEALRILEVSARGATAGLGDMVDISKLLVFSMNAYRKSGYSATNVADIFTAAVREGALEAGDFAGAIQSVIPIASAMGVSLEQVAGSMAAMSLQGASAQNAAVYLKGMLNALLKIKPGGQAEKALKKFGVTAEDLYVDLAKPNGLMNVLMKLQDLSKKTTGNQFLKEIFRDIRAMTAELSLTGDNLEYNQFVMNEVAKAGGDLARADNAVSNGMDKMRKVISSLGETIRIKLGDDLAKVILPAFKSLLETIKGMVDAFDRMSDGSKKLIIHIIGLVAALGPLALFGSLLKYAYGGFINSFVKGFIFARNVVGALNGDLVMMGKLSKNVPKWANRAKAFNVWRLEGGLSKVISSISSAPLAAMTLAVGVGTIALFKYAKHLREAAEANRAFNKTQVIVNGTMKAFNEMDKSDIEQMTLDELMLTKAKAAQVWTESYKAYKQYEKNLKEGAGSQHWNKKYMQEEANAIEFAKKQYEDLTATIYEMQKRLVGDRARAQRVQDLKKTKEETEAVNKVMQDMYDALGQVNEQAKYMKDIKKPFDEAEARANILLKTLDDLTGGDIKLHFEDAPVQKVIGMLKEIGIDFTKADDLAEDFAATLATIDMKKMLLGKEYDANTAKLQAYEKELNRFLDEVLDKTKRPTGPTVFDEKQISDYVKGMKDAQEAIDALNDENNMKFLRAMSTAFGDIDSQIEVVNGALQSAERKLKTIGIEHGVTEEFLKQAEYVKALRRELDDLTSSKDIIFFADMAQAIKDGNSYLDFLNANISKLKTELERMSAERLGNTVEFQTKAKDLEAMQNRADAIKILQDGISEFFQASQEDMQNFGSFVESWARSVVRSFQKMVADILAKKIIFALFGAATAGVSGGIAGVLRNTVIPGLASGGVVPPGYPNDTYPAALTSGEGVLPADIMKKLSRANGFEGGVVRFEIEGDRLVGILKKKSKQNTLY